MNYLFIKLWLRRLKRNKIYTVANILGLTLGFTAFILISLFVRYELNWDRSQQKYDRIYRIQRQFINTTYTVGGNDISPHMRPAVAEMIEGKIPEFEKITVIRENGGQFLFSDPDHQVYDDFGIHADSCFFDVFTYDFIAGNKKTALNDPHSVVLSETVAKNLFGDVSAIDKTVLLEKKYPLKVTGVYKDLPFNSSLRPSYIISFSTLKPMQGISRNDLWEGSCMTYALLNPGANAKQAEQKIKNLFSDYREIENEKLQMCSLSKVYLNFNDRNDYLIVLKLFTLIGIFILVMSGFNYINLSLAKASMQGKEVAVKKVIGSRRELLITQFLAETIAVSLGSLVFAFGIAWLLLPLFSNIVDKQLHLSLSKDWQFILASIAVAISTGILSGIYPALFLSSHKISTLFKGNLFNKKRESFSLKKALITFQFAISLFLIVLTLSFSMQIKYITHKDLGLQKEGLLYASISFPENELKFDQFRSRLIQHPEIKDVSVSKNFPFVNFGGGMTNWEGNDPDIKVLCRYNDVSYDYLDVIGAKLIAGRNFSPDFPGDVGKSCIINESAAKVFGWDNPVGKRINNNQLTIIGVVSNFIYQDMHNVIDPTALVLAPNSIKGDWIFAFRTNGDNEQKSKEILTAELTNTFPNDPFEIRDLTTAFDNERSFLIYHSVNKTLYFFTFLNILLAIVGMFGLVSFTVSRRIKEIGIRKINGSSIIGIFQLLNKDYYLLIVYALVLAFPTAWLVYSNIPSANKLPAQPWVFVLGVFILLIIVLISTSYQSLKAATRNPVDALRYE